MIAIYLSPLYLLACVWVFWRLLQWLGLLSPFFRKKGIRLVTGLLYLFLCVSPLTAFLLPSGGFRRIMQLFANYWLGVFLYAVLVLAAAELAGLLFRLFYRRQKHPGSRISLPGLRTAGALCLGLTLILSGAGIVSALLLRTTRYEITVDKPVEGLDSLQVVLAADLHIGYNTGCGRMRTMVEEINVLQPDLVVLAGDIFDNEYEALDNPEELAAILGSIQSRYGVYACYGNHDVSEKILAGFTFPQEGEKASDPRMDQLLEEAGITLLRDETVLIDDAFYLCGRADSKKPGRGITVRQTPEELLENLDLTKPVLVLDHEPEELAELARAGADVDLSGHTHNGQTFPGNLVMPFLWENPCGYLEKDGMHSIVTSGVGVFGPNMRLGTTSEICSIQVTFQ